MAVCEGKLSIRDYFTETVKIITVTLPGDHSTAAITQSCSTARAAINPVSGRDYFAQGQNFPHADYKMFTTATVTEGKQVTWGGKRFDVIFVKDTFNMAHHKLAYLQRVIT
jgi:hypothetical protein